MYAAKSHALNGAHYLDVSANTGHDAQILHENYASVVERKSVFVEF